MVNAFFWRVQMHILRFFRAVIDQQTWSDGGSVSERRLRSELLSLACHLDDPPCLERARQSFKHWLQSKGTLKYVCLNYVFYTHHYKSPNSDIIQINSSHGLCAAGLFNVVFHHVSNGHVSACVYHSLPTDVAKTVFSVGAQEDRGWASLLHTYNISSSAAQKSKILFALTCSRDANKLHRYSFSLFHFVHSVCCHHVANIGYYIPVLQPTEI